MILGIKDSGLLVFGPPVLSLSMVQKEFAVKVVSIVKDDPGVIGLAAGGSFITGEMDEYSDLDLVLVTRNQVSGDKENMISVARKFGKLITAFTGEHVGEPRLLICLFDDPLLHVDIKFLTLPEFYSRVEDPVILFERDKGLTNVINTTTATWPVPDLQWIEDRIWTWVHYLATKLGRGELFECIDGLGFIRARVLAPLLQLKHKIPANALRKLEMRLTSEELESLQSTIPDYDRHSIVLSLEKTIELYRSLRTQVFPASIGLHAHAEEKAMKYLNQLNS